MCNSKKRRNVSGAAATFTQSRSVCSQFAVHPGEPSEVRRIMVSARLRIIKKIKIPPQLLTLETSNGHNRQADM